MASLSHASESLIGKAANTLMYQTGKDLGKIEGEKLEELREESNIKMEKFNKEVRSQESESRIPSQIPKKLLVHKVHKEHKDFLFF